MNMYLMSKGLWGAIAGDKTTSEIKEQQDHAAIVLNLSYSQLMHVIDSTSARDAIGTVGAVSPQSRHVKSTMAEGKVRLIHVCGVKHERSRHGAGRPRDEVEARELRSK